MNDDLIVGIDNRVSTEVVKIEGALKGLGVAVEALDSKLQAASDKAGKHFKHMVPKVGDTTAFKEFTDAFKASQDAQLKSLKDHMRHMESVVSQTTTMMQEMIEAKIPRKLAAATTQVTETAAALAQRNLLANTKYATDLNTARQQIEAKGTSTMLASLQKRAESIRRILESEHVDAIEIAKRRYGSDFVSSMQAGLKGDLQVLAKHGETRLAMIESQGRAEAKALAAARRIADIGTTGQRRGSAEIVGQYTAYDALRSSAVDTDAGRYEAWLKKAAATQSEADARYVALRKDSLARGRVLIVAAAKTELKAQADALAAEVSADAGRYETWLKKAAATQSEADARYVALRKDSLARGRVLIVAAAKTELKAQADALAAEVSADAGRYEAWLKKVAATQSEADARYVALRKDSLERGRNAIIRAAKANLANAPESLTDGLTYFSSTPKDPSDTLRKTKAEADNLSKSFQRLKLDGNDVHSMARGLASGFNLLWLTWGNLAPLLAGAAISNGFVQTTKSGMEVAHTMETIAVLGGGTREEMALLTAELDRLGKSGPYGPLEVAKAMKSLSLAGLQVNEILAATPVVLNFAIAGTTDLETAAKTLVTVSTAFKMGVEGFAKVADLISYASAKSMTSVEAFSGAMKTASVINSQYGVSIEDVTLGIMALSKVGIEHGAAGTALRNTYADLSGRTKQVTKLLEAQKIVTTDGAGKMLNLVDMVGNLDEALNKLSGKGQADLIKNLTSERGSKMLVEILEQARAAAVKTGVSVKDAMRIAREELDNYYGFAAVSAVKLAQTSENQFKQLKSVMQTTMNQAFREMEPQLYLVADALQKAFASPSAVAGLSALVSGVANLTKAVAENLGVLLAAVAAYAALKTAQVSLLAISAALQGVEMLKAAATARSTAATVADTVATEVNTAATGKNAVAKGGVGAAMLGLGRIIPALNIALGIGAAAWITWEWWTNASKDTAADASELYRNKTLEDLRSQTQKLTEINKLRAQGLSLSEAEARYAGKKVVETAALGVAAAAEKVRQAREAEDRLTQAGARFEPGSGQAKMNANYVAAAKQKVTAATAKYNEELARQGKFESDMDEEAAKYGAQRKIQDQKLPPPTPKVFGDKELEIASKESGGRQVSFTESFDKLKSISSARMQTEKEAYAESVQMLKTFHAAGLSSEGQYQVELAKAGRQHYLNIQQQADDDIMVATWVYEERLALVKKGEEGDTQRAKLKEALDAAKIASTEKVKQTESEYNKAVLAGAAAAFVETRKLIVESDKFIESQARKLKVETELQEARKAAEGLAPEILAGMEARIKAESDYAAQIEKVEALLETQQSVAKAAWAASKEGIFGMAEAASGADARVKDLLAELAKLRAAATGAGVTAASTATADYIQKDFDTTAKKIKSDLADAILSGGKNGGSDLKKWFKEKFVLAPIKAFLEVLVSPIANMAAGFVQSAGSAALGGAAGAAGSGALGGMMGGMAAGMGAFGSGVASGLTAWGAGGSVTGLLGSGSSLFAGGIASGLGTLAGALGPIAIGLMLLSSLIKKSTPHMGAGATYSAAGGLEGSEEAYKVQGAYGFADTRTFSEEAAKVTGDFAKTMVAVLDTTATTFGKTAGYEASTAFADDSSKDGAWGSLVIKKLGETVLDWADTQDNKWAPKEFSDAEVGSAEYAAALASSTRDVLMQMDLPAWAEDYLTKIGDAPTMENLSWAVDQINIGAAALAKMAEGLVGFAALSTDAVSKLVAASGGMDKLAANASSYYDNFYTEAEKATNTTTQITKALAEVGLATPKTRKEFRALVEEQMSLGEAGMEAVAALMGVSSAFATISETSEDLVATADKFREFADSITQFRKDLLLGDESTLNPLQKYRTAQAEFSSVAALAKAGDETALGKITDVAQAFLDASKEASISAQAYSSDFNAVQRTLLESATAANAKADVALLLSGNTLDGSHAQGLNYVPFDGYRAELHRGERVLTAQEAESYKDSATLEALVRDLISKVSTLEANSRATAYHTSETNKRLDRVMPDGDALAVRTAA